MKFDHQTFFCIMAAAGSMILNVDAFAPHYVKTGAIQTLATHPQTRSLQRMVPTQLFMAVDDDDDEDDEIDGPLGNGVDSVGWLPTVIGAEGEETTSAKEVRKT